MKATAKCYALRTTERREIGKDVATCYVANEKSSSRKVKFFLYATSTITVPYLLFASIRKTAKIGIRAYYLGKILADICNCYFRISPKLMTRVFPRKKGFEQILEGGYDTSSGKLHELTTTLGLRRHYRYKGDLAYNAPVLNTSSRAWLHQTIGICRLA